MNRYNVATETVETFVQLDSVVLIVSSGKLIFNGSRIIKLDNGDEVLESGVNEELTLDKASELYQSIVSEYLFKEEE